MPKQRVVFCTYPGVYSDIVLDELLKAERIELVAVVISRRILRKDYHPITAILRQVQQSGLRYAAYLLAVTGLYSGLQRLSGQPTLRQRLKQQCIPLLETRDINNATGRQFLSAASADILLTAHFNQLLDMSVLEASGLTGLNIHPSLLPAYKGVDPAFYALLRREPSTGVTVHYLAQSFDSGDILQQQALQIRWHDSLLSLNMKLFKLGAVCAVEQITRFANAEIQPGQAQSGSGNYDSWPNPYETRQFRRQRKFLRWKELWRFTRCFVVRN
ncbi:MAG: hypothetical protein CSA79_00820 [Thiothrix nivea]|nr:MAG: hypothetical protein CSA79_00820 [Thiothrix nivea]